MSNENEGRPWTIETEETLKMLAQRVPLKSVAQALGRSELSIGYRAYKLLGEKLAQTEKERDFQELKCPKCLCDKTMVTFAQGTKSRLLCPACLAADVNAENTTIGHVAGKYTIHYSDLEHWLLTIPGLLSFASLGAQKLVYRDYQFSWVTKKPPIDEQQFVACVNCGNTPDNLCKMFRITNDQLADELKRLGICLLLPSQAVDFHWRKVNTARANEYLLMKR
jgi:hypothetical protein